MPLQPSPSSKVEEVQTYLRKLAFELGPEAQFPTVRALCETLSTTRVTLMSALNALEAEQLLYRKERKGVFVSPHIYHKVIHILFDVSNFEEETITPFWSMLWVRMSQEAQQRATMKDERCHFHLVAPRYDPRDSLPNTVDSILAGERVDGLLTIGFNIKDNPWFVNHTLPSVSFAGHGCCVVQLDSHTMGRIATETLIWQGCKKIGIWMCHVPYLKQEEMGEVMAMQQVLKQHRLPWFPELAAQPTLPPSSRGLSLQEQGYLLAQEIFGNSGRMRPDGIFIADEMLTDGALIALEQLGIEIGKDLHLVTHANVGSPMLFGRTEGMTVIEFDPLLIARAMFSLLDQQLAGQQVPEIHWLRPSIRD